MRLNPSLGTRRLPAEAGGDVQFGGGGLVRHCRATARWSRRLQRCGNQAPAGSSCVEGFRRAQRHEGRLQARGGRDHRVSGEGRVGRCLNAAATSGAGPTPICCGDKKANPSLEARASAPFGAHRIGLGAGPRSSSWWAGPELQKPGGEPGVKFPGAE